MTRCHERPRLTQEHCTIECLGLGYAVLGVLLDVDRVLGAQLGSPYNSIRIMDKWVLCEAISPMAARQGRRSASTEANRMQGLG